MKDFKHSNPGTIVKDLMFCIGNDCVENGRLKRNAAAKKTIFKPRFYAIHFIHLSLEIPTDCKADCTCQSMGKMYVQKLLIVCLLLCTGCFAFAAGTTYYSQGSTTVNTLTNWNTNRLGGGASPANFTSGDIFVIQGTGNGGTSPHSMTTGAAWTITGGTGKIQIENGAALTATSLVAVPNFQVDNGGFYIHNAASAAANGNATDIPGTTTRVFGASSTVEIQKWTNGSGTTPVALPVITGAGWGNLIINVATLNGSWNQTGTLTTIQGNFSVLQSGGGTFEFRFTGNTDYTGTVGGDFTVSNAALCALTNSGATVDQTVGGNIIVNSDGIFSLNSGGSGSVFVTLTVNGSISLSGTNSEFNGTKLGGSGSWLINLTGDLNISGGKFNFTGSSASSKSYIINIGGNYNQTGGSFGLLNSSYGSPNIACLVNFTGGASSVTFTQSAGTFAVVYPGGPNRAISFAVKAGKTLSLLNDFKLPIATYSTFDSVIVYSGGTLSCGTNNLTGFGNFTLKPGATLQMGSVNGITNYPTTAGNIQNVGAAAVRSFSKGANYIYDGSAAQVSGIGIPDSVRSLTINNATGLTLSNASLTDTVSLTLTSGRIKTDATHSLKLASTCSVSSTANIYGDVNEGNQASYVSGPLIVECSNTNLITLPIGKDTTTGSFFAPVKLKPVTAALKNYTAEYFPSKHFDQANIDAGQLHHVSFVEFWEIACNVSGPGSTATVALSWRPSSGIGNGNPADSTQAKADLVLAHYFNDGFVLQWHIESSYPSFTIRPGSNINDGYLFADVMSGIFSPFTIGTKSAFNLLPIKLLGFTAKKTGQRKIMLQWSTKAELPSIVYEVERSKDGINFAAIASVASKNGTENNYSITDNDPLTGYNYYRLKIKDGRSVDYSGVIKVKMDELFVSVYPNPATKMIFIQHDKAVAGSNISIFAADGKKIYTVKAAEGSNQSSLSVEMLPAGLYIIEFNTGTSFIKQKFIKQ